MRYTRYVTNSVTYVTRACRAQQEYPKSARSHAIVLLILISVLLLLLLLLASLSFGCYASLLLLFLTVSVKLD